MSNRKETVLNVQGMTCRNCVHHVDEALRGVAGVAEVDVRLQEGKALVRHDAGTTTDALLAALDDAGYDATVA